jgi:hypothetical protein
MPRCDRSSARTSEKGWKDYTKKLAKQAGLEDPTDDELRQFDPNRPGKKVSNDDWKNPNDPDATITRMKDRTTRSAYKAEHAVDLDTDIGVAATVHPGNAPDTQTIIDTAIDAAVNAEQAGVENDLQAIVADNGYHSTKVVTLAAELGMRAYIPERASPKQRRWTHKAPADQRAVHNARRRIQSERGKQLSRLRSELTERSFAHVCDTGGARRTWLRGLASVAKRHLMMVAARNLSTIMPAIIGIGGPRSLQGLRAMLQTAWTLTSTGSCRLWIDWWRRWSRPWRSGREPSAADDQTVRDSEIDLGHGLLALAFYGQAIEATDDGSASGQEEASLFPEPVEELKLIRSGTWRHVPDWDASDILLQERYLERHVRQRQQK